ncbi:hypothetical protein D1Z98_10425 [Riemerella anatipestifer]|nr:hypothetical protein [Riemerella anatipestifer]MRM95351.1 hypothetical protein [Riemerella anatipestifer]
MKFIKLCSIKIRPMKKIFMFLSFICFVCFVQAQTDSLSTKPKPITSIRSNDVMISPFPLIAGGAINVSYERLIDDSSGVGLDIILGLGDISGNSQFSPYYRRYFGKKYASGFFIEGFLPITTSRDEKIDYYYSPYSYSFYPVHTESTNTTRCAF